jgi:hypothetical protein
MFPLQLVCIPASFPPSDREGVRRILWRSSPCTLVLAYYILVRYAPALGMSLDIERKARPCSFQTKLRASMTHLSDSLHSFYQSANI